MSYCHAFVYFLGELEKIVAELEEINNNVAVLQAGAAKGVFFPLLSLGNKHVACEKVMDKQVDLQELESILKELQVQLAQLIFEILDNGRLNMF